MNEMQSSFWQGEKVLLRAIEPADWETYFAWNADDEQARALDFLPFPQSQASVRRFAEQAALRGPEGDNFRFVVENAAREVVGDITTHDCNPRTGNFSWGVNIKSEHRHKGYAIDALQIVLHYYFQELRYQKVTVSIHSYNAASIRLHQRLGFQQEGRIRRTVFTQGQYFDELIWGLTHEEFLAQRDQA